MKKIAFTICSNNYLAQAKTLGDSILRYNNDYAFCICLCDKKSSDVDYTVYGNFQLIFVEDLEIQNFKDMVSRYNVTELNTSVKPFFIDYLFKKNVDVEIVLYLDPDTAVFSDLKTIEENFKKGSILLTPHIFTPIAPDGKMPTENIFLNHGIYNLGFIGLMRSEEVKKLLLWWKNTLAENCYEKIEEGIFVDQLPMNFAPIFFDKVVVLKEYGMNMAPWNLHERKLSYINGRYMVNNKEPLVFYHFSNYNPNKPKDISTHYNRYSFRDNAVLRQLYDEYRGLLIKNNVLKLRNIECAYNKLGFHRTTELAASRIEIGELRRELMDVKNQLDKIRTSYEWRILLFLQKVIKVVLPKNSKQRKALFFVIRIIKRGISLIKKITRSIKSKILLILLIGNKIFGKRKYFVNKGSKKIVFIDHSFHKKTKSSEFIINFLKKYYTVEIVYDESWREGDFVSLDFIDESYHGVIFWQSIPCKEILEKIKNKNIVFFPMFDQSFFQNFNYWYQYRKIKIINFSKKLHFKLRTWGFDSMYIQYFPKTENFIPGNKSQAFFWQRLSKIDINLIEKIFDGNDIQMHIHKAVDPGQLFIQPKENQEEKFNIQYSEWFESKSDMLQLIKERAIYIAPREYEGIGMSFLEALSMGKAVIAVDNPTMNEYIEHGKNGYLFNLKKPEKINLTSIEDVQKNAYNFMQNGFNDWDKNKIKIIEFIKKNE